MDLASASGLLSGGGSFLSGVSSLFGGKKKRGPSFDDMISFNIRNEREMFQEKMNNAAKYGIHPLAAIGMNPASGSTVTPAFGGSSDGGGFDTSSFERMGQGVSRALEAYQSRDMRDAARQSLSLDLENKRLQNARLASEIRLMQNGGANSTAPFPNPFEAGAAAASSAGHTRYQVTTQDGPVNMWSPEILKQMESDYLRVPIEYIRALGADIYRIGRDAWRRSSPESIRQRLRERG